MEEKDFRQKLSGCNNRLEMTHDGEWFRTDPSVAVVALDETPRFGGDVLMQQAMHDLTSWPLFHEYDEEHDVECDGPWSACEAAKS